MIRTRSAVDGENDPIDPANPILEWHVPELTNAAVRGILTVVSIPGNRFPTPRPPLSLSADSTIITALRTDS